MIARSSSLTKLPTHAAFVNLRRAFDDNEHRIVLDKMIYLNPCLVLLTRSGFVDRRHRLPAILILERVLELFGIIREIMIDT